MRRTPLAIVGAGPYGLAVAVEARAAGLDFELLGRPMDFWRSHMPHGMLLRSPADWHLDPRGVHTFRAFLAARGLEPEDCAPIPLDLYLAYADWFADKSGIPAGGQLVSTIDRRSDAYELRLEGGEVVRAESVVAAPGYYPFRHVPDELLASVPLGRVLHSAEVRTTGPFARQRCLIVGGRQSAFEQAALLREGGAAEVHVVYRHATPQFERSDWSWVDGMVAAAAETRGWFRGLPEAEREEICRRFWAEGRGKLEPWLGARVQRDRITLHPHTTVTGLREHANGELAVRTSSGETFTVDHAIAATGFKVDVGRIGYLSRETILPHLATLDGWPVLDEDFQSSLPGLYLTGLVATNDFGPFFGFVRGCAVSARIIVAKLTANAAA